MRLILGILIGASITGGTLRSTTGQIEEPRIVGDSGYLRGVELVDTGYERVCDSIYWDKVEKAIICD